MAPIYTARYSNVPVWVSNVNNVNVMRRQGDGWVNATHLLKVADFDKPKRTKILERDVQTGEHEKVQGGYGKYQGTWIPVARALELSESVGILPMVEELLNFDPQDGETPAELPKATKTASVRKNNDQNTMPSKRARKTHSVPNNAAAPAQVNMAQPMQTMPAFNQPPQGMWPQQYPQMPYSGQPVPSSQLSPDQRQSAPYGYNPNKMQQMQMMQMQSHYPMRPDMGYPMDPRGMLGNPPGRRNDPPVNASMPAHNNGLPHGQPMGGNLPPHSTRRGRQSQAITAAQNAARAASPAAGNAHRQGSHPSLHGSPTYSPTAMSSGSEIFSDGEEDLSVFKPKTSMNDLSAAEPAVAAHLAGNKLSTADSTNPPSQYMIDYTSKLLDFFMNPDKSVIPSALLTPEAGPHINQGIDDEGNTVFHWACAIGQVEIMQALIGAGANIRALNNAGHCPLVRAIMFTNNYETRTFPKVLDMLQETISLVDSNNRTILHLIALTSSSRTRAAGARYYLEMVLAKLTTIQNLLTASGFKAFIDHKDKRGDTALHISARNNSRTLSRIFLIHNASALIPNKAGVTAEETLISAGNKSNKIKREDSAESKSESENTSLVSRVCKSVEMYLMELAKTYDMDLANKTDDVDQVSELIEQMDFKVTDAKQKIPGLLELIGDKEKTMVEISTLELDAQSRTEEMHQLIERAQARDLAFLVQQEESKIHDNPNKDEIDELDGLSQAELHETLTELQKNRRDLVQEVVLLHRDVGDPEKIMKYRKLLSLCCEIQESEVDELLDSIANALTTQD